MDSSFEARGFDDIPIEDIIEDIVNGERPMVQLPFPFPTQFIGDDGIPVWPFNPIGPVPTDIFAPPTALPPAPTNPFPTSTVITSTVVPTATATGTAPIESPFTVSVPGTATAAAQPTQTPDVVVIPADGSNASNKLPAGSIAAIAIGSLLVLLLLSVLLVAWFKRRKKNEYLDYQDALEAAREQRKPHEATEMANVSGSFEASAPVQFGGAVAVPMPVPMPVHDSSDLGPGPRLNTCMSFSSSGSEWTDPPDVPLPPVLVRQVTPPRQVPPIQGLGLSPIPEATESNG